MISREHRKAHWPRFERLEARRNELCRHIMAYDIIRHELWLALKLAPPALATRYDRLCRVSSLYRTAWL